MLILALNKRIFVGVFGICMIGTQVDEGKAQLIILDTQDITGEPTAVVDIPERVPFGFHCAYVPGQSLPNWPRVVRPRVVKKYRTWDHRRDDRL